ncbi:MAG: hypothetical protein HY549_04600 [Elusimicrobia bacterium]|nr:hypothetical protein [Elusimicrobiota bacterium]
MFIGEVVGNAWGTRKHPALSRRRLLLVRPIDPMSGKALGDAMLALDTGVGAGPGNVVLVMDEGGSARAMLKDELAPVRTAICGVVDQVSSQGRVKRYG